MTDYKIDIRIGQFWILKNGNPFTQCADRSEAKFIISQLESGINEGCDSSSGACDSNYYVMKMINAGKKKPTCVGG